MTYNGSDFNNRYAPTAHAPHCTTPEFEWQQTIWPGLAARGRCIHCGAVTVDRSTQLQSVAYPELTNRRSVTRKDNTR